MKHLNTVFVSVGAAVALVALAPQGQARSGNTLAIAEKACLDQGIKPRSTAFEKCVERVVDAYDRTGQMPTVTWPTTSVGHEGFDTPSIA